MLAVQQPASWPVVWSTRDDVELKQRLSKLPFYTGQSPGLGDVVSDVTTLLAKSGAILTKAGPYLDTVLEIAQDPALPQLVSRVKTLKALNASKVPTAPGAPSTQPGVGLSRLLPIWDAAIFYEKYPWAPWAIGAGVVVVLGGIGYGIGRATKKCRAGFGRTYRRKR